MEKIMTTKKANEIFKNLYGHVTFGEMLNSMRHSEDLTQKDFAKKLNISQQDLCDIEKGRKNISIERAVQFAELLNDSPEVFAEYVIQDQLYRAGLNCKINIKPNEAA
jgi:DNA-binding XRE family transcriptional regulator